MNQYMEHIGDPTTQKGVDEMKRTFNDVYEATIALDAIAVRFHCRTDDTYLTFIG